jgi:hypothetical protein
METLAADAMARLAKKATFEGAARQLAEALVAAEAPLSAAERAVRACAAVALLALLARSADAR